MTDIAAESTEAGFSLLEPGTKRHSWQVQGPHRQHLFARHHHEEEVRDTRGESSPYRNLVPATSYCRRSPLGPSGVEKVRSCRSTTGESRFLHTTSQPCFHCHFHFYHFNREGPGPGSLPRQSLHQCLPDATFWVAGRITARSARSARAFSNRHFT